MQNMVVNDVTSTDIRAYVRRFHITDECVLGPMADPRGPRDPYMRRLADEYNIYIHRLTYEFYLFFTTACFNFLPGWVTSKIGNTYQNFLHIQHNSTHFKIIQHKTSYNY
jgi:hypothetical protein